jgi:signal transduction histidine kinase
MYFRLTLVLLLWSMFRPASRAQQVEVSQYDVDQGLPQSMVTQVVQDAHDFIWIGTGDGLARFDGTRFVVYKHDPQDSTSLPDNSIWGIAQGDSRHLWVGTRHALARLDLRTGRFTRIHTGLPAAADGCWQPMGGDSTSAWFHSPLSRSLLVASGGKCRLMRTGHSAIQTMHRCTNGDRMALMLPDTLVRFRNDRPSGAPMVLPIAPNERITDVLPIGDAFLVLSADDAWTFTPRRGRTELPHATRAWLCHGPGPKFGAIDAQGRPWVAVSERGVVLLGGDLSIGEVWPLVTQEARPLKFTGITTDRQGNVWSMTDGKGVFKIAPQAIKFGRIMPGMGLPWEPPSFFVRGFAQWGRDAVLIAFFQGGFAKLDERDGSLSPVLLRGVTTAKDIQGMASDADGLVWLESDGRLLAYRPPGGDPILDRPCSWRSVLLTDREGRMMLLSQKGLERWDAAGQAFVPLPWPGLAAYMDSLYEIPAAAWLVNGPGLLTKPMNGPMRCWGPAGPRPLRGADVERWAAGMELTGAACSGDSICWTTTDAGLFEWDAKNLSLIKRYTIHDSLPDQYLYGMLPAGDGSWWISSNNGLARFTPAEGSFTRYGRTDGLQSKEFNTGALFRSASGRLYFGGVNGVNWLMPGPMPRDTDHAVVRLTAVQRDGIAINPLPDTITLGFPENRVQLSLAVLEFTAPERNRFRYRIPGYINGWREGMPGQPLLLEHVPAGDHPLEVQGLNGDGVAGPVERLLFIRVPLPFRDSPWAFVLAGGAIASILAFAAFAAYRRRNRILAMRAEQEMKELRMRTRLAKDMHDDVGSGLARITALARTSQAGMAGQERLEKVSAISSELLANLRDVVWMNDPRHDELSATLLRLRDLAHDLFEDSGAELRTEFPSPLPVRTIDGAFRHQFFLIAKEALHNAYKYAHAGRVWLRFILEGDAFRLEVEDDGCGMPVEHAGSGNGVRNMQQRAEAIGAELRVAASGHGGVRVTLRGRIPAIDGGRTDDRSGRGGG